MALIIQAAAIQGTGSLVLDKPTVVQVTQYTALSLTIDLIRGLARITYSKQDPNGVDVGGQQVLEIPSSAIAANMGDVLALVAVQMQNGLGVVGTMTGATKAPPPIIDPPPPIIGVPGVVASKG